MQTMTVNLSELNEHPAQMRTTLDAEGMASLTLQVHTRGLDPHQPIVVARPPLERETVAVPGTGEDGMVVISGHRRLLARLLAYELEGLLSHERVRADGDGGLTEPSASQAEGLAEASADLDKARSIVAGWAGQDGGLIAAYGPLAARHGEREITVVLLEGDQRTQVLALQASNFSQEEPDMLGQARSFHAAAEAGASVQEIANNVGKSVHYVQNHLAVVEMPEALIRLIVDGALGMGVARPVASLPAGKREGLAAIVVARAERTPPPTVAAVKAAAQRLGQWDGIQVPLRAPDAATRNRARIMQALWGQVVAEKPLRAWGVAADAAYQGLLGEPWTDTRICAAWIAALAPEVSHGENGRADWDRLMVDLAPDVSCATCRVSGLPYPPLSQDLALPCRSSLTAEEPRTAQPGVCLQGMGEHDPFLVQVPMAWAGLQGVSEHPYTCTSWEDLQAAWLAQQERERAEVETVADRSTARPTSSEADAQSEADTRAEDVGGDPSDPSPAPAETPSQPVGPSEPRPIDQQRAIIRSFMENHTSLATEHPWATLCALCQHLRGDSPTKDPSLPHCEWAARLKTVEFFIRGPVDGGGPCIPLCRQFAPQDSPWRQRIPAHSAAPSLSRDWMLAQIRHLVADGHKTRRPIGDARTMMEFMTGRPIKATGEGHRGWFLQELEKQVGELSDEQVQTLFVWVFSEWRRVKANGYGGDNQYPVPVGPNGSQSVLYSEREWIDDFPLVQPPVESRPGEDG